jgi:hypothetical protein
MANDQTPQESESRSKLEERAQALLQDGAERLDGRTRSHLTQARNAALDAIKQPRSKALVWWLPAGVAAATVLAVMLTMNSARESVDQDDVQMALSPVEEIEIVTAEDSLEFYRDVEFYAWLDSVLEDEPVEPSGA